MRRVADALNARGVQRHVGRAAPHEREEPPRPFGNPVRKRAVTLAIVLAIMCAGIISVALECAVAGSVLLGGALLIARYAV